MRIGKNMKRYCSLQEFREDFLTKESLQILDRMKRDESRVATPKLNVNVRSAVLKGLTK